MTGGIAHRYLLFPSARIYFETDALCGLEGMLRQGLQGQGRADFPKGGGDRLDQPIFQDTHTPETAVGKPAPAC